MPDFTHQILKGKLENYSGGAGRNFFCFLPQTPNSLYFDSILYCFIFNKVVVVLESYYCDEMFGMEIRRLDVLSLLCVRSRFLKFLKKKQLFSAQNTSILN